MRNTNTTNTTIVTTDRAEAITVNSKFIVIRRPDHHEKIAFEIPEEMKAGILNVCNHFAVNTSMMIGKKIDIDLDHIGTCYGYVYRKDTDYFGQTIITKDRIERLKFDGFYTKNGFIVNIEVQIKLSKYEGQHETFTMQLDVDLFKQHNAVCAIARELM